MIIMFNSSPRLSYQPKQRQISRAHMSSIPVLAIALYQGRYLWTPSNGRWHFAAWIPDQYFPIPMAWVRKFWVPTGDENHVTNVAPWILRWTPAQKFLAFYFSLGGNLDKNNVRSFFCHVNAAVLSVISTKQDSWQFLKCLSLRYIPKRYFLPYISRIQWWHIR